MRQNAAAVLTATLAAGALIAQQVGGKATRDAFYLSNFDVTTLPTMIMVAAGISIAVVLLASGAMARLGPTRLVPVGLAVSGVLYLAEWVIALKEPRIAAVLVYLHSAVIGLVLISGFWTLITERFDPRTAKRRVNRIAAGGTLGGILGGLIADRMGASFTVITMLPILGAFHVLAAIMVRLFEQVTAVSPGEIPSSRSETTSGDPRYGLRVLKEVPYLRDLALLVTLTTTSGIFVAYVFQVEAVAAFQDGESLIRFFAVFYTAISVITFLMQSTLSRRLLERIGLTRTVATQPLITALTSLVALFVPGLRSTAFARGAISVLGNSTFRSGYELHFSAIPKKKKRATKTIIDVGFNRLGDAIGGGLVKLVLLLGFVSVRPTLLALAVATGLGAVLVVRRLQRGYVQALEESLLNRAVDLNMTDVTDSTTRLTVLKTISGLKIDSRVVKELKEKAGPKTPSAPSADVEPVPAPVTDDPVVAKILELRSGDPARVKRYLSQRAFLDPATVPLVIRLLAWDEVAEQAIRALASVGSRISGQLADALLDPDEEFSIRRRVPRVLVAISTEQSARALFSGLSDKRFEVRFQCGRALARMQAAGLTLPVTRDGVYAVVMNEVKVDRRVWESRRLLERLDDSRESVFVDEVLRDRANRSLEHVFTVLSLTLPQEPLKVAFRGLHTTDLSLRGTALEYLESVLPQMVRQSLWPFLVKKKSVKPPERSRDQILEDLLQSNESIQINLSDLRRQHPEPEE
jgi:hypothetical protein